MTERTDDADANGVASIGDSLKLTFANCIEKGVTSNGVVSFRLTGLSANSIAAHVTLGELKLHDGTDEIAGDRLASSLNGDRHVLTGFTGSAATDFVLGTVT